MSRTDVGTQAIWESSRSRLGGPLEEAQLVALMVLDASVRRIYVDAFKRCFFRAWRHSTRPDCGLLLSVVRASFLGAREYELALCSSAVLPSLEERSPGLEELDRLFVWTFGSLEALGLNVDRKWVLDNSVADSLRLEMNIRGRNSAIENVT